MRRLLLGLCCLLGLVCFADALTKHEVLHLIHHITNEFRQERIPQVKDMVKKTINQVISPEQTACVKGYVPSIYKDLNLYIGMEMDGMRSEFGTKTISELIPLTEEQLKKTILSRLETVINWFPYRLKQISNCIQM